MLDPANSAASPIISPRYTASPKTPAPIDPPHRSSSLAFSSARPSRCLDLTDKSTGLSLSSIEHAGTQSNISKKTSTFSTLTLENVPPGHVAQMQKVFQTAQATVHRDMQAAASPVSSIAARMKLDPTTPPNSLQPFQAQACYDSSLTKSWRYSLAPALLAASTMDVREPSPALPALPTASLPSPTDEEPISSGYSTPDAPTPTEESVDTFSNVATVDDKETDHQDTELDQPLQELKMSSDDERDYNSRHNGPLMRISKRVSMASSMDVCRPRSPRGGIILPEMAEAAAQSARVKRMLLREEFLVSPDERGTHNVLCPEPQLHRIGAILCPDPEVHRASSILTYADMTSDIRVHTPTLVQRPPSGYGYAEPYVMQADWTYAPERRPGPEGARATATGSPMPFTRGSRPLTAAGRRHEPVLHPSYHQNAVTLVNEHFQPGWYQARYQPQLSRPQAVYSFSTAAAKVREEDQAPDSRMRDSYKTDTLTALPAPRTRYRRYGIGASVPVRGVSRHYQRLPSVRRPSSAARRSSSRHTYNRASDVRFRSSPPRAIADVPVAIRRKRAADDNFMIAEGRIHDLRDDPALQLRPSDEIIKLDDQTAAAVRLSIFGTNTPEALHNARHGIRELSPNVQIYRKDDPRSRKKRRPSYWDGDLQEVRESPEARGGIGSPSSAKKSFKAEIEVASITSSGTYDPDTTHEVSDEVIIDISKENMTMTGMMGVEESN